MLDIKAEKSDGVMRIALEGKVNSATARDLSQQMESELDGVHRIELDFAKLDYISSAGLRVLIAAQRHMESIGGETLCVKNASGVVLDTLEMSGFRGVINVN